MVEHEHTVEFTDEEVAAGFQKAAEVVNALMNAVGLLNSTPENKKLTMEILMLGACTTIATIKDNSLLPAFKGLRLASGVIEAMNPEQFCELDVWEFRSIDEESAKKLKSIRERYEAGLITIVEATAEIRAIDTTTAEEVERTGEINYTVPQDRPVDKKNLH